jgi:DNA-binding NarL/FixJ family response regulator
VTEITSDGKPAMDLIRDLHTAHPNLPILVLSILDETFWAERVLRAGCRGFVMKREATPTILGAIRKVLSGEIWVSERVSSTMIRRVATGRDAVSASPLEHLSDRELEIFQMLGAGLTSREIAQRLHLSVKTVDGHRDRMKEKLQMESSAKLLRYAILSTIAAA